MSISVGHDCVAQDCMKVWGGTHCKTCRAFPADTLGECCLCEEVHALRKKLAELQACSERGSNGLRAAVKFQKQRDAAELELAAIKAELTRAQRLTGLQNMTDGATAEAIVRVIKAQNEMLTRAEQASGDGKSLVRLNAEKDPDYCPYCMRCPGLVRMSKVAPFYWRHSCGAQHDERTPAEKPRALREAEELVRYLLSAEPGVIETLWKEQPDRMNLLVERLEASLKGRRATEKEFRVGRCATGECGHDDGSWCETRPARMMEVVDPSGRVSYRRPEGDPDLAKWQAQIDAGRALGYTIRPMEEP